MEAIEIEMLAAKIAEKIQPPGRWMNLKKASAYSGIRKDDLVLLATQKKIRGVKDTRLKTTPWVFDKLSIDDFRERQISEAYRDSESDKKVALEIFESMRL